MAEEGNGLNIWKFPLGETEMNFENEKTFSKNEKIFRKSFSVRPSCLGAKLLWGLSGG